MAGLKQIALGLAGRVARMSRKKQIILGLVALWLLAVGLSHVGIGGGHEQAQARPAAPPPPWAGITKAQALVLAQRDDLRSYNEGMQPWARETWASYTDTLGADWMAHPSYSRVVCGGYAYWKLSYYGDEPRPWYESKALGFNVGFDNCNTARPADILRHGGSGKAQTSKRAATTVSPAVKKKVRAILLGSLNHYEHLLHTGERALGNTQYATSMQGVDAFSDPDSAASRFSAWRQKSNAESDLSFLAAFSKADSFYNAKNEPDAIGTWRDDMSLATGYFNVWTEFAVGWQIKEHTTAQMQASTRRLERMLAKARRDVAAVVAGR